MSTERRTQGVYSSPAPKDAQGNRLCRNCHGPMPKGARHNCSPKCSEEWVARTSPSYARYLIHRRDKSVCALCGIDTDALKRQFESLPQAAGYYGDKNSPRSQFLEEHGVPHSRAWGDWWDADHIKPVIEGGGECGLDNFRTLCIPCHKKVTAELRARIAAGNRSKKRDKRDRTGLFADQL
jgi:5-methylcytosine-specific restriction enzyme A